MRKKKVSEGIKLLDFFVRMQQEYPEMSPDRILIIETKILKNIITPARTELIEAVRENKPDSVGELARILKRPQEAVSRDLRILNNYGVLDFVQLGKVKKPRIEKDIIVVPS